MKVITLIEIDGEFITRHSDSPSEYLAVVDEVNVLFGKEHGGIAELTSHRFCERCMNNIRNGSIVFGKGHCPGHPTNNTH